MNLLGYTYELLCCHSSPFCLFYTIILFYKSVVVRRWHPTTHLIEFRRLFCTALYCFCVWYIQQSELFGEKHSFNVVATVLLFSIMTVPFPLSFYPQSYFKWQCSSESIVGEVWKHKIRLQINYKWNVRQSVYQYATLLPFVRAYQSQRHMCCGHYLQLYNSNFDECNAIFIIIVILWQSWFYK